MTYHSTFEFWTAVLALTVCEAPAQNVHSIHSEVLLQKREETPEFQAATVKPVNHYYRWLPSSLISSRSNEADFNALAVARHLERNDRMEKRVNQLVKSRAPNLTTPKKMKTPTFFTYVQFDLLYPGRHVSSSRFLDLPNELARNKLRKAFCCRHIVGLPRALETAVCPSSSSFFPAGKRCASLVLVMFPLPATSVVTENKRPGLSQLGQCRRFRFHHHHHHSRQGTGLKVREERRKSRAS